MFTKTNVTYDPLRLGRINLWSDNWLNKCWPPTLPPPSPLPLRLLVSSCGRRNIKKNERGSWCSLVSSACFQEKNDAWNDHDARTISLLTLPPPCPMAYSQSGNISTLPASSSFVPTVMLRYVRLCVSSARALSWLLSCDIPMIMDIQLTLNCRAQWWCRHILIRT